MSIWKNIYKSIFRPLDLIQEKTSNGKLFSSILTVITTAITGSIIAPVLLYYYNKNEYDIGLKIRNLIVLFLISVLTWLLSCLFFWLCSYLFKKQIKLTQIISTWGFSYIPNLICIIAYFFVQTRYGLSISHGFIGFLLNTFFIMLLVWKAIYFFIEMKYVIRTDGKELFLITLLSGIVFSFLAGIGFQIGIQVPML